MLVKTIKRVMMIWLLHYSNSIAMIGIRNDAISNGCMHATMLNPSKITVFNCESNTHKATKRRENTTIPFSFIDRSIDLITRQTPFKPCHTWKPFKWYRKSLLPDNIIFTLKDFLLFVKDVENILFESDANHLLDL